MYFFSILNFVFSKIFYSVMIVERNLEPAMIHTGELRNSNFDISIFSNPRISNPNSNINRNDSKVSINVIIIRNSE